MMTVAFDFLPALIFTSHDESISSSIGELTVSPAGMRME
jgi:hypothetical protein